MKTLFDGVHLLEGEVSGRPLQLVYLRGAYNSLLLDAGAAGDPARFVVPELERAGGSLEDLTWLVNSHPDFDHVGGNAELKRLAPCVWLLCADADREACMGGEALMRLRYDVYAREHGLRYEGEVRAAILVGCGEVVAHDMTLTGGDWLRLSEDWAVQVLVVPGHAAGHLALHDPKNRALYAADALHGDGYRGLDGTMKLAPTYYDVDAYLATAERIAALDIDTYVGCHWPVWRGAQIAAFCAASKAFVEHTEARLLEALTEPRTLGDLCGRLGPQLGTWNRSADDDLRYALHAHLERLVRRGWVSAQPREDDGRLEFALHGNGGTA